MNQINMEIFDNPASNNNENADPVLNESAAQNEMDDQNDLFDDSEDHSYGNSYEKYNGYNEWSDDAIDDAFEGDPEATWYVE